MQTRGVSRWPKKLLHTEPMCSNQSTRYSCCSSSASLVGWQLTAPCPSRATGKIWTGHFCKANLIGGEQISGGTEGWNPQYLTMSSQLLHNPVNLLVLYYRKTTICHNSSNFPMIQWSILLTVSKIQILLRVAVNLTSFGSSYMRNLLKITEEMLFYIPCLLFWHYFSVSYL